MEKLKITKLTNSSEIHGGFGRISIEDGRRATRAKNCPLRENCGVQSKDVCNS